MLTAAPAHVSCWPVSNNRGSAATGPESEEKPTWRGHRKSVEIDPVTDISRKTTRCGLWRCQARCAKARRAAVHISLRAKRPALATRRVFTTRENSSAADRTGAGADCRIGNHPSRRRSLRLRGGRRHLARDEAALRLVVQRNDELRAIVGLAVQRLVRNDDRRSRQCGRRDAVEHLLRDGDAVERVLGIVRAVDRDRGPAQAAVGAAPPP